METANPTSVPCRLNPKNVTELSLPAPGCGD